MARSIAGLFADRASAEQAVEDLKAAGFDQNRIGIVMRDKGETRDVNEEHGTHSTESAVGGSLIGGTAGALLAATGALVIPGIGPFISGGILATSLVGGAAGWLVGGLAGLGIPREEAEYYEGRVQQGSALVTVDAAGRDAEARQILLRDGAEDLQSRGYGGGYDTAATTTAATATGMAQPAQGTAATYTTATAGTAGATNLTDDSTGRSGTVEVVQLRPTGDATVQGTASPAQPLQQTQAQPLQQTTDVTGTAGTTIQTAGYDATMATRPLEGMPAQTVGTTSATTATAQTTSDDDIRVPVYEEELVANKRQEEIGAVRVHKDVLQEQESVPVTLQREQVTVERVPVQGQPVDPNAVGDAFTGADIEVPVMGEQAVVDKRVQEVEEVHLQKRPVTEQEQLTDTVRRERVVVDGADQTGATGTTGVTGTGTTGQNL